MMTIACTKNNSFMSRAIQYLLKENCSHFVIIFDQKVVFHSNLFGCHIVAFESFKKKNEIVNSKVFSIDLNEEESYWQRLITLLDGKPYDFKALLYFAYCAVMFKFFGKPIPKRSLWGDGRAYLCTEIAEVLDVTKNLDLSITSAGMLWEVFKD